MTARMFSECIISRGSSYSTSRNDTDTKVFRMRIPNAQKNKFYAKLTSVKMHRNLQPMNETTIYKIEVKLCIYSWSEM